MEQNKISYLNILDNFPNPIWRAGIDTKCNFFNQAWLEFTGRTIEEEMGDGWTKGIHEEDLNQCVKIYLDSFEKRKPFQMEYRIKHKDGTYHWLLDCGTPFYDEYGNLLGYIGSCYDISEIKKYHEKIIQDNVELAQFNKIAVDRELKMIEMKMEVNTLLKKLGEKPKYC
jgi:PAS domain S-box-containing protein